MVDKMESFIHDQKQRNELFAELNKVQLSQTEDVFKKSSRLFVSKWKQVSSGAMAYFESEWLRLCFQTNTVLK